MCHSYQMYMRISYNATEKMSTFYMLDILVNCREFSYNLSHDYKVNVFWLSDFRTSIRLYRFHFCWVFQFRLKFVPVSNILTFL